MNRKRDIQIRQINKWKAILNVDISGMNKGIQYEKVYSSGVGWTSVRSLFIIVALEK